MDPDFWLERWKTQQIGFHLAGANPLLVAHWPVLGVGPEVGVFVPLCGKTRDLQWLADRGHRVVGVELAASAAEAFFAESGVAPRSGDDASLPYLEGGNVRIYTGDFFALRAPDVADCGAVYDRAALIALPPEMRSRYVAHLRALFGRVLPTLLITIDYDQQRVPGPPFSVPPAEIERHFASHVRIEQLASDPSPQVPPKLAEAGPVTERVTALRTRR